MQAHSDARTTGSKWDGLALAGVLLVSLWLRLTGLDWDGLHHLHPDERYIVWVGTTIEVPSDWKTALDPALSTFNPFHWRPEAESAGIRVQRGEPRAFAYGHWPLYLGVGATHLLARGEAWATRLPEGWTLLRDLLNAPGRIEYNHLLLVGRTLAALFDTLTVGLTFLLGRELFGWAAGLLASTLVALAVLHIQQAHFFVTDPFLTTAVVAAVYWMVRRSTSHRLLHSLAAGALLGLAVGAKFSAVTLALPLGVALTWGRQVPPAGKVAALVRPLRRWWRWARRPVLELAAALAMGTAVFVLTNPFAVLDRSCAARVGGFAIPGLGLRMAPVAVESCYLKNIGTQAAMVRGNERIPFTLQYVGTPPYLYYLDQMLRWGLGPPAALVGFGGLVWGTWRLLRRGRPPSPGEAVLLSWALPFFAVTGGFQVKFLRYLLPLTPFLAILGAGMLIQCGRRIGWTGRDSEPLPSRGLLRAGLYAVLAVTVATSGLWAAAFVALYRAGEHPWVSASHWLFQNAPARSTLATEHWDHALPLSVRGENGRPLPNSFRGVKLEWFDVEDRREEEERRVDLGLTLQQLARSDYAILASNRLYGVIPRLPERYPEAAAYYELLLSGRLGFELVHWEVRSPGLGPVALVEDSFARPGLPAPEPLADWRPAAITIDLGPADESFTVYDHPLVMIFENRARLTAKDMEALIRSEAGTRQVGE